MLTGGGGQSSHMDSYQWFLSASTIFFLDMVNAFEYKDENSKEKQGLAIQRSKANRQQTNITRKSENTRKKRTETKIL